MSFFLGAFIALIGIFLLCAIIAEMSKGDPPHGYKIPTSWNSQIYDTPSDDERGRYRKEPTGDQPNPNESSSTAWYAILIVCYILCLIVLWHWHDIDNFLRDLVPETQETANPVQHTEDFRNPKWSE